MPASVNYLSDSSPLKKCIISILARWPEDNRFYKVSLERCNDLDKKCFVKFEDDTVCWMETKNLHMQLDLDKVPDDKIFCCICDTDTSQPPNLMVLCDLCQQGYHVGCHKPLPIEAAFLDDEEKEWFCDTCLELAHPDPQKYRKKNPQPTREKKIQESEIKEKKITNMKIVLKKPEPKKLGAKKSDVKKAEVKKTELKKTGRTIPGEKLVQETTAADNTIAEDTVVEEELADDKVPQPIGEDLLIQESDNKEILKNGDTLEEMAPELIQCAKALAEGPAAGTVTTKDFVNLVSPGRKTREEALEGKEEATESLSRKRKFKPSRKDSAFKLPVPKKTIKDTQINPVAA